MPLRLPDKLPAIDILKNENIFVMDNSRATTQDIRPLRIVILNLIGPVALQHTTSAGNQFHEIEEPYSQEYPDRAHDDVLS